MYNVVQAPQWWIFRQGRLSVQDVLNRLGVTRPPVDVVAIAHTLGVHVVPETEMGVLARLRLLGSNALVTMAGENTYQKRFRVAHALGHLMLHGFKQEWLCKSFDGDVEQQANAYAAAMMMPLWMTAEYGRHVGFEPEKIAEIFDVSVEAARARLQLVAGL